MIERAFFQNQRGFTIIELVVVIVLLGILAVFALPRFVDLDTYRERGYYDEVAGALRYAQKLAVASGCEVRFTVTGSAYQLQQRVSCTSGGFSPLSNHPINSGTVSGIGFSSAPGSFDFDAMGRSSSTAIVSVGTKTITVVAETGYVDAL